MKRIILAFIATMGLFVSSACAANHHNEVKQTTSIETPSLFMSLDKYKEVNEKDYLLTIYERGWPAMVYYFKTPGDISCNLGAENSNHTPSCQGLIPSIGGLGERKIRSLEVNDSNLPYPTALVDSQPGDPLHVYLPGNSYSHVKLLPVGFKFNLDKPNTNAEPSTGATCVVPDKDSLGCINTVNHGFLVTRDSTIVF